MSKLSMPPQEKESSDSKPANSLAKLTLVMDKSKAKPGISQYLSLTMWLGWMGFYVYLPITAPLLWYFCPYVLYAIGTVLLISAFYPINEKLQPKVIIISIHTLIKDY